MQQKNNAYQRLSKRQDSLLINLFAFGRQKLAEIDETGEFEVSKDTLRADLNEMEGIGFVEISEERVGGEANDAFVYELTDRGTQHAYAIQVSDDDKSVQRRLDDLERELAEIRAERNQLRDEQEELLENQKVLKKDIRKLRDYFKHQLDQITYALDKLGHPIVPYLEEDEN
ncbi:hypothetical protein [Haloarcula laminariae]|uniref:hypothetical protein n=1 Tax=Haloarcula laminariae TaxID=2961577 RepID=UPI0021CA35A0|nr:hypothetical protein [Halomicroarcula laminariae]